MKKLTLVFITFFVIINSALYGLNNPYYSLNDKDWEPHKKSDEIITFVLKNYSSENEDSGFTPNVTFNIINNEKKTLLVSSFSKDEINQFKTKLENSGYKTTFTKFKDIFCKSFEKSFIDEAKKKYGNLNSVQLDKIKKLAAEKSNESAKEFFKNSGIKSVIVDTFGSNKAFRADYVVGECHYRRFAIPSLHRTTVVEFEYPASYNLDSADSYKKLKSSFKNKDNNPTYLNYIIYGTNLLNYLIIIIISVGISIFKKLKQ